MHHTIFVLVCIALASVIIVMARRSEVPTGTPQELVSQIVSPTLQDGEQGLGVWAVLRQRVSDNPFDLVALIIFTLAIIHAFCTGWFRRLADYLQRRYQQRIGAQGETYQSGKHVSFGAEVCHFLGEVEVVFGLWTIPLIVAVTYWFNWNTAVAYLNTRDYTEPLFVVVVMTIASTRPILRLFEQVISWVAKLGGQSVAAWWLSLLTIGPLLGSLITEPGAMTVTALLLTKQFFSKRPSRRFAYATLGLLFVNISIGGDLTHFAAPPVLIVAKKWGWNTPFMFTEFGWKSMVSIVASNILYYFIFRKEFRRLEGRVSETRTDSKSYRGLIPVPVWITLVHLVFLGWVVFAGHEPVIFIGTFLLFLAFYQATSPHQRPLNLRSPMLVGLFLTGLVIHGGLQGWWIEPLLSSLAQLPLFVLAVGLTTVNDNAAITYLSSLAPQFTTAQKYAVVSGAVTGGGLTIIANAPNPAAVQLLGHHFRGGISHMRLFLGALIPTIIAALAFVLLGYDKMFGVV